MRRHRNSVRSLGWSNIIHLNFLPSIFQINARSSPTFDKVGTPTAGKTELVIVIRHFVGNCALLTNSFRYIPICAIFIHGNVADVGVFVKSFA